MRFLAWQELGASTFFISATYIRSNADLIARAAKFKITANPVSNQIGVDTDPAISTHTRHLRVAVLFLIIATFRNAKAISSPERARADIVITHACFAFFISFAGLATFETGFFHAFSKSRRLITK